MSKDIRELIKEHEKLREEGINLIPSENHLSQGVKEALKSDLAGRYHSDYYGGSEYAQEIVSRTRELAEELFDVRFSMVKPISGNICDLNILFSYTNPGDKIAMLPYTSGGYPLGVQKFNREKVPLPAKEGTFEIDVKKAEELYRHNDIALTILGASYFPFPHPVKEIRAMIDEHSPGGTLVYDGSHVLGLIATGTFQAPLQEGAGILMGSTHKTFYGPQGGMILTDSKNHKKKIRDHLDINLETGIGLVDNPHPNRIAALGVAIEEMLGDPDYGKRVVKNSKALARTLFDLGVPVKFESRGFTESHQVFLDMEGDRALELCHALEEEGIFVDRTGRMGTAEATHRGMDPDDMKDIAHRIHEVYSDMN